MAAFNRHRKNAAIDPKYKSTPWKDRGYVAWLGWGGTSGVNWAIKKAESIRKGTVKASADIPELPYGNRKEKDDYATQGKGWQALRSLPKHLRVTLLTKTLKVLEKVENFLHRLLSL